MKYLKWSYRIKWIKCRLVRTLKHQIFISVRGMLIMIMKMKMKIIMKIIMKMIMKMIIIMIMTTTTTTATATITTNQIRIPQSTNL